MEAVPCLPQPWLRPWVLGYSGFRAAGSGPIPRRILPLNCATIILDLADPHGLVTGPRRTPIVDAETRWRFGVSIGLTPAGVAALLDVPMRELADTGADLAELLGPRAAELAERLAPLPDWSTRFAALDDRLTQWLRNARRPEGPVATAWWRLQTRRPVTVKAVADELGIGRRGLELAFARQVGLTPKTVARIARFQHTVERLSHPGTTLAAAATHGYADQAHLTREVRALAGVAPSALFAFVQDTLQRSTYRPEACS